MAKTWIKRGLTVVLLVLVAAGFAWLLRPEPIQVDVARASVRHMEVTVDEEGVNRIKDVYVVSAPVSGRVERAPREVGDRVAAGATVVATFRPAVPSILDPRTRLELQRAVEAARAAKDLATAELRRAEAGRTFAEAALRRTQTLSDRRVVSPSTLEKAQLDANVARQQVETAKAQLDVRTHDLEVAEARLINPNAASGNANGECCMTLTAPVNGIVLRTPQISEQIVPAGTPLVEIGNPLKTEITADLLSTDAVKVKPGDPATITGWGGGQTLKAKVRRVDPAAFTKVSALGIEEQRVRVVLEVLDPPAQWTGLGHEYRVFVHITIWQSDNALQAPLGALFRSGGQWAVFRVIDGRARLTPVRIGQMNAANVQIADGLKAGDVVILHPSDQITDGASIQNRPVGQTVASP
jgi:HlyD family secretion protein